MDKKQESTESSTPLVHKFDSNEKQTMFTSKYLFILVVLLILGVGTGYLLANKGGNSGRLNPTNSANTSSVSKGTVVGSNDTSTFKDTVEGTLKEGGIDGEGAFHLERPGGVSQNVYLTSSIVDLSTYVGKKIKVWGQTQKAQKAGWLMDVGRIEVL